MMECTNDGTCAPVAGGDSGGGGGDVQVCVYTCEESADCAGLSVLYEYATSINCVVLPEGEGPPGVTGKMCAPMYPDELPCDADADCLKVQDNAVCTDKVCVFSCANEFDCTNFADALMSNSDCQQGVCVKVEDSGGGGDGPPSCDTDEDCTSYASNGK